VKREHFGSCSVHTRPVGGISTWRGCYPTLEGAIETLDPFQHHTARALATCGTAISWYLTGKEWAS
jgi:hypothetical protein